MGWVSLPDDLHQHAAHDLALHVRVGILLSHVVAIPAHRFVGRQLHQPVVVVLVQAVLVDVDEDKGRDVYGVYLINLTIPSLCLSF